MANNHQDPLERPVSPDNRESPQTIGLQSALQRRSESSSASSSGQIFFYTTPVDLSACQSLEVFRERIETLISTYLVNQTDFALSDPLISIKFADLQRVGCPVVLPTSRLVADFSGGIFNGLRIFDSNQKSILLLLRQFIHPLDLLHPLPNWFTMGVKSAFIPNYSHAVLSDSLPKSSSEDPTADNYAVAFEVGFSNREFARMARLHPDQPPKLARYKLHCTPLQFLQYIAPRTIVLKEKKAWDTLRAFLFRQVALPRLSREVELLANDFFGCRPVLEPHHYDALDRRNASVDELKNYEITYADSAWSELLHGDVVRTDPALFIFLQDLIRNNDLEASTYQRRRFNAQGVVVRGPSNDMERDLTEDGGFTLSLNVKEAIDSDNAEDAATIAEDQTTKKKGRKRAKKNKTKNGPSDNADDEETSPFVNLSSSTTAGPSASPTIPVDSPVEAPAPKMSEAEEAEPEMSKAEQKKPEVTKPEVLKSDQKQPEVSNPEISKTEQKKPAVFKPETPKAEHKKPEAPKAEISKTQQKNPEMSKPEMSKPEMSKLEASKPEMSKSDQKKPEKSQPDPSNSELSSNSELPTPQPSNPEPSQSGLSRTARRRMARRAKSDNTDGGNTSSTATLQSSSAASTSMADESPIESLHPAPSQSASFVPAPAKVESAKPAANSGTLSKPTSAKTPSLKPEPSTAASLQPASAKTTSLKPESSKAASLKPESSTAGSLEPAPAKAASLKAESSTAGSLKPESSTPASIKPESSTAEFSDAEPFDYDSWSLAPDDNKREEEEAWSVVQPKSSRKPARPQQARVNPFAPRRAPASRQDPAPVPQRGPSRRQPSQDFSSSSSRQPPTQSNNPQNARRAKKNTRRGRADRSAADSELPSASSLEEFPPLISTTTAAPPAVTASSSSPFGDEDSIPPASSFSGATAVLGQEVVSDPSPPVAGATGLRSRADGGDGGNGGDSGSACRGENGSDGGDGYNPKPSDESGGMEGLPFPPPPAWITRDLLIQRRTLSLVGYPAEEEEEEPVVDVTATTLRRLTCSAGTDLDRQFPGTQDRFAAFLRVGLDGAPTSNGGASSSSGGAYPPVVNGSGLEPTLPSPPAGGSDFAWVPTIGLRGVPESQYQSRVEGFHFCTFCGVRPSAGDQLAVLCPGCGDQNGVRYCSVACLLVDAFEHSHACLRVPFRPLLPGPEVPRAVRQALVPLVPGISEPPARFRQRAFAMFCSYGAFPKLYEAWARKERVSAHVVSRDPNASEWYKKPGDYAIFRSEQTGGNGRKNPTADVIFSVRLLDSDPRKQYLVRTLNALFIEPHHQGLVVFLFRLIQSLLMDQQYFDMTSYTEAGGVVYNEFCAQFAAEFNVDCQQWEGEPTFDHAQEWLRIVHRLSSVEIRNPILEQAWPLYYGS